MVYINAEDQRKVNCGVVQLAIKPSLECPILQLYYISQLEMPFLLVFGQNLDIDITKASETVQVRIVKLHCGICNSTWYISATYCAGRNTIRIIFLALFINFL